MRLLCYVSILVSACLVNAQYNSEGYLVAGAVTADQTSSEEAFHIAWFDNLKAEHPLNCDSNDVRFLSFFFLFGVIFF